MKRATPTVKTCPRIARFAPVNLSASTGLGFPTVKFDTKQLDVHLDDRGYLFEVLREDDEIVSTEFAQITVSEVYPGVIKAWHRHQRQTDFIACLKGNLKVGLAVENDAGVSIDTECIGEDNREVIKVPPGVWHGMTPVGDQSALVLYIQDQTYDPDDEERLPHDEFGDIWSVSHR